MTIYSLIHSNLRRILVLSLSAAGAALLVYSFFSLRWTEKQAVHFVTNHVEALAQAGVNSQNVNEIDKEIARFALTWKETQDLDLRIVIFFGGRLIAHAGQLQPFRFFSSKSEETINLPSGDSLRIKVELGLERFLLFSALFLAILAIFIYAVFRLLSRSMQDSIKKITSPLESRIDWLKNVSSHLPVSAKEPSVGSLATGISEIDELEVSIGTLLRQIAKQEEEIALINFDRGRVKMAEQVAHSIKGFIATLQLKTSSLTSLSEKERRELSESIGALRDISGNLLRDKTSSVTQLPHEGRDPTHLLPSVQTVIAAKGIQYADKNVSLSLGEDSAFFGAFTALEAGSVQTVLASLIDNSVEASASKIKIDGTRGEQFLELEVSDNGVGVPNHLLPLLMKEGATFGKPGGNGIGLFHADQILTRIGGSIQIESQESVGTKVRLLFPLTPPPQGFTANVEIPAEATLVMVDDDRTIHDALKLKLKSSRASVVRTVHCFSAQEFENWIAENGPGELGKRFYLFDYDLKDKAGNGLDLIERHGLTFESVLISGMTSEPFVKSRIARLGVRWMPKDFLAQLRLLNLGGKPKAASFLGAV